MSDAKPLLRPVDINEHQADSLAILLAGWRGHSIAFDHGEGGTLFVHMRSGEEGRIGETFAIGRDGAVKGPR